MPVESKSGHKYNGDFRVGDRRSICHRLDESKPVGLESGLRGMDRQTSLLGSARQQPSGSGNQGLEKCEIDLSAQGAIYQHKPGHAGRQPVRQSVTDGSVLDLSRRLPALGVTSQFRFLGHI